MLSLFDPIVIYFFSAILMYRYPSLKIPFFFHLNFILLFVVITTKINKNKHNNNKYFVYLIDIYYGNISSV